MITAVWIFRSVFLYPFCICSIWKLQIHVVSDLWCILTFCTFSPFRPRRALLNHILFLLINPVQCTLEMGGKLFSEIRSRERKYCFPSPSGTFSLTSPGTLWAESPYFQRRFTIKWLIPIRARSCGNPGKSIFRSSAVTDSQSLQNQWLRHTRVVGLKASLRACMASVYLPRISCSSSLSPVFLSFVLFLSNAQRSKQSPDFPKLKLFSPANRFVSRFSLISRL